MYPHRLVTHSKVLRGNLPRKLHTYISNAARRSASNLGCTCRSPADWDRLASSYLCFCEGMEGYKLVVVRRLSLNPSAMSLLHPKVGEAGRARGVAIVPWSLAPKELPTVASGGLSGASSTKMVTSACWTLNVVLSSC